MENHKEDILKKFLQDTFSDYEPEPSDATWENIFAAIQPEKPSFWTKSKPWITSAVIILTAALLWYSLSKTEEGNTEIALNERKISQSDDSQTADVIAIKPHSDLLRMDASKRVEKLKSEGSLLVKTPTRAEIAIKSHSDLLQMDASKRVEKLKSDGSLLVKTPTRAEKRAKTEVVLQKDNFRKSVETTTTYSQTIATDINKEIIVKSDAPKVAEGNHPIVERQSDESVVNVNLTASTSERVEAFATGVQQSDDSQTDAKEQVKAFTGARSSVRTQTTAGNLQKDESRKSLTTDTKSSVEATDTHIQPTAGSGRVETLTTDRRMQSDDSQTAITQNTTIEQVRYIRPMESLKNKAFTLMKIDLNTPVITPSMMPNREAKPVRQHTYLSMSITPIQTYRILTIQNQNVQNVQTNSLFDSERNGWQFDLGITKPMSKLWNFRTNLTYLRMRQWSEYQIGTDELVLRNNNYGSPNSNLSQSAIANLEVVGQTVTESKILHMVGLKMDVQKFFKITPKNRYFLSTGTQVMYENSQKQSNIFLNVSAGFQHVISNHTFLTIEPTASYSLNNFNDSKSLLQANGYNLGLKMGVSFRVK